MNWIGKLVIVLMCAVALTLPSSPVTARSTPSNQAESSKQLKKKPARSATRKKTTTFKKVAATSPKKNSSLAPNKTAKKTTTKQITKQITKQKVKGQKIAKQSRSRKAVVVSSAKTKGTTSKAVVKRRGSSVAKRSTTVIARSNKAATRTKVRTTQPAARPVVVADATGHSGSSTPRVSARSAMIMDAVTGKAIYAQASDTPAQPASTIKVLTGVISLDVLPKNELVPVSRRAAMMPRSKVYLSPGKKYPAGDLINAVLLASANDASVALAEKIAGSEQAFAQMMTAKARSFGATKTVCKTANGLTASGQYTTARDLAVIFSNAMRNNEFANKMAVTEVVNSDGKVIKSHNRALWQVDGAEGGKTGYTDVARKTYVGKFRRDNDEIIVSLMGSENMWGDVKRLVEYGFAKKRQERSSTASAQPAAESRLAVQLPSPRRQLSPTPAL